jgi:large conductance mechanosensitive channel
MIKGFKEFIMRGNVIDLAVAVVIGAAFTAVVNSIVEGIFNPLIAAIFNAESLKGTLVVPLPGDGELSFGLVLAAIIQFLLVAAVVYFVFVVPLTHVKHAQERQRQAGLPPKSSDAPATELEVLSEIRDLLAARSNSGSNPTP